MAKRHPHLFERLADIATPVFVIAPVDLPLVFVLSADAPFSNGYYHGAKGVDFLAATAE